MQAPGEQTEVATRVWAKRGRIQEFSREWRSSMFGEEGGRLGTGGFDRDVRFNSQQRDTGGGREIKISRNKKTGGRSQSRKKRSQEEETERRRRRVND